MDKKGVSLLYNNILETVGKTPLVKLNKILTSNNIQSQVYAKCEFLNAGGSIDDRAAINLIEEAEKMGKLKEGDTIVEATHGNLGIGLALCCSVKGYKLIVVTTDKTSNEKVDLLRTLGAEVIIADSSLSHDSSESYISIGKQISEQEGHIFLD